MTIKRISELAQISTVPGEAYLPVVDPTQSSVANQNKRIRVSDFFNSYKGFTQAGSGSVSRSVTDKLKDTVSVKDFGAVGDGVADDTAAIQNAVNATQGSGKTLILPLGTYKLSSSGTRNLPFASGSRRYGILITNTLDIVIEGVVTFSIDAASAFNAFLFTEVENSSITGGTFTASNPASHSITSYQGVAVVFDRCKECVAFDVNIVDAIGGVLGFQCTSCSINNCSYNRVTTTQAVGSAFALYSGYRSSIINCVTYGGTNDGDTGLFGTGRFNKIFGCRTHGFTLSDSTETPVNTSLQGIYVDAGQLDATVESCYAQGYYYAIDVKSNISNCLVTNNTVYKNKVGIAVRRGELNTDSMGAKIFDNLILPYTGNGNTDLLLGYATMGILVQDFASVEIRGNKIGTTYSDTASQNWIAIRISQKSFNEAQRGAVVINDNQLAYSQSLGGITSSNGGPYFIHFSGDRPSSTLQMQNNSFTHSSGYCGQVLVDGATEFNFVGNVFSNTSNSVTSRPAVVITEIYSVNVTGNSFMNSQACVTYTSPTSGGGSSLAQLIFSNNTINSTVTSTQTIVSTSGQVGVVISGNIRYRLATGAPFGDGRLLDAVSAGASSKFVIIGNLLNQTNYGSTNYYRIDGVDIPTGANILASNIV